MHVPDPDKIHEKMVRLSIWIGIQLELDREKKNFIKSKRNGTDIKVVLKLEFHTKVTNFSCWICDSTGTSALMPFFHKGVCGF